MKSLFNRSEIYHDKNLPNLSNDDPEEKEWFQKVADLKKSLTVYKNDEPKSSVISFFSY